MGTFVSLHGRVFGIDSETGMVIQDGFNDAGAKNGSTVTAKEYGDGAVHKTVLTLVNTPVSIVSVTTGNGVGGTLLYTFPAGYIANHGCTANLSISVAAADQADFTDAAVEGDIGIGTLAPANADALGTDATDDNFATATAFTMASFIDASVTLPPEASANYNGTSTAIPMYLSVFVDAADIDDGVTTEVLVSGTVTVVWSALGDF